MSEVKFIASYPHERYHDYPGCWCCERYDTAEWEEFVTEEEAINSLGPGKQRELCDFCRLEREKRTGGP